MRSARPVRTQMLRLDCGPGYGAVCRGQQHLRLQRPARRDDKMLVACTQESHRVAGCLH